MSHPYPAPPNASGDASAQPSHPSFRLTALEQARIIAEYSSDLVALFDQAGCFVFAGPSYQHMLGHDPRALAGVPALELVHPADRENVSGEWARLNSQKFVQTVFRHLHADGSSAWIEARLTRIEGDETQYVLSVARNRTDRPEIEAALHEKERQLTLALEAARMGTWQWDIQTGKLDWFGNVEALHGLESGAFGGTYDSFLALIHPDDRERVQAAVNEALIDRTHYTIEVRTVWPDGSLHWLAGSGQAFYDEHGMPSQMIGVVFDITERKRFEQTQQVLVEAGTLVWSSLDYTITLNNLAHLMVPDLADWCVIDMLQDDGAIATVVVAHADPAKEALGWELVQRFPVNPSAPGGTAAVLRSGAPEIIEYIPPDFMERVAIDAEHLRLLQSYGLRSSICVPLMVRGRSIGTIALIGAESGRRYTAADLPLLEDLAHRAALAIDNARLYIATERQARRMQALAAAAQAFAEVSLDLPALFERVTRHVAELIGDFCAIRLVSADGGWLKTVAAYHIDPGAHALVDAVLQIHYRVDEGFMGRVVTTGEALRVPVISPDAAMNGLHPDLRPYLSQIGIYSLLMVPLRVQGRVIGSIGVTRSKPGQPYTHDDQVFLQDLADRAAMAIANAQLYATEQQARASAERAAERVSRLQTVTAALAQALTPTQVAEVVIEHGLAALGAVAGCVAVVNPDGAAIDVVRDIGYVEAAVADIRHLPLSLPMPMTDAVRTGAPVYLPTREARQARYPHLVARHTHDATAASAALPLPGEGRVLGVLGLNFDRPRAFNPDEQAFMLTLARQCAQALDRARLYEAELQARAEAEAAVRVREMFLSVASHELKTPITSLLGNTELLQRRDQREQVLSERDRRTLNIVRDQALRLNRLVTALLDISRLDQNRLNIERVPLDLVALVRRVVTEIEPSLHQHSLECTIMCDVLPVLGDELRLEQVLQNLIQNGIKYSPEGGSIFVQVAQQQQHALVTITDCGIGIPQAALPRLFQRFFRADNADHHQISGLGIGLYVVREIIDLHGGTVHVESVEGQGSTFTIKLPLHENSVLSP